MDKFRCIACGKFLTIDEYENNINFCKKCCEKIVDQNKDFFDSCIWCGFNNIDMILENKRYKSRGSIIDRY